MDSEDGNRGFVGLIRGMSTETKTGLFLTLIFFFSVFLSTFFVISPAVKADYAVSGGSDAYYNMRIVQYILSTHHQLLFDPGLNYPVGLENPRPPFFMWLSVMLGYAFSPFLGGVYASTMTMFLESTAIGGALIVFPTYFLGKEIFDRRVGIIAALLVAMSPLTLMKSIATIGLFDIYTALFGVLFIYYFLRAVNTFKYDGQVSSLSDILTSIRVNPLSVTYSLLAAVSLAASMLTWVGTISLILILVGAAVVQLVIFALKRKSALPVFVSNLFFGFGFLIAFPWYYVANFVPVRFDYPLILWAALLIVSLYFLILEKRPWILSVGAFVLIGIGAVLLLYKVDRNLIYSILSGQHYFIKNKIYDTIAEAQSLPLGEDILEFGAVQFFASFIGLAYLIYRWVRTGTFSMTLAVLYFGGIIIISMIASKFLYFGAVAASVLTAYILVKSFELLKFKETMEKAKGRSLRAALRKEIKFSHYVAILIVVFLLVVPTTFYAVDSAIPYNNKTIYDSQLYNVTPSFMRPANYSSSSLYYLGAFGAELATPNQPINKFESWFANQDAQLPPNQRPAFMSWWDYGFQTIEQGQHPVMADNFQDGIYPAAQILLAQNESQIIGVMIARMISNYSSSSLNSSGIYSILVQYLGSQGASTIINYLTDPKAYIHDIYSNPAFFGNYDKVQGGDAYYILVEHYLANEYPLATLINLYQAIEQAKNQYMSYIGIDSSLFPFNGTNTGIFYAPAYLGDFPWVNASGEIIPVSFYNITVTDTSGNKYPLQDFPPGDTAVSYTINYTPAFYNTTIYRGLIGYPPSAVGATSGIPGISSNLSSYPTMQGWGMPNFELVYKSVLWNPYTDYQNHTNAWKIVPLEQGYQYLKNHDGTVDMYPPAQVLENDFIALEYFPGAIIHGQVTNTAGQPIAGIRVTLDDQYGIPHMTVLTNSTGYYSIFAVAGNDTLVFSTGRYNALSMAGNKTLSTFNITISEAQANRESYSPYGIPTWNITHNLVLPTDRINGVLFLNLVKSGIYIPNTDVPISGTVKFVNSTYGTVYEVNTTVNGSYGIYDIKPYSYNISAYVLGQWYNNVTSVVISSNATSEDVPVDFGAANITLPGNVTLSPGSKITFSRGNDSVTYNLTGSPQRVNLPVGVYNVSARNGDMWDNLTIQLHYNTTTKIQLDFSRYYTARFFTTAGGKPVSATVVLSDSSGKFSTVFTHNGTGNASVAVSVYSAYASLYLNGRYYAATDIFSVTGNMNITLNLSPSYLVSGSFTVSGIPQNGSQITVTGNDTLLNYYAGPGGSFSVYLPPGQYAVVSHSTYNSNLYVSWLQFTVSNSNLTFLLDGLPGSEIKGNVTYGKTMARGLLTTEVDGAPYYDTMVTDGSYTIYVPNGLAPENISFISPGFAVLTSSLNSVIIREENVTATIVPEYSPPYPVSLSITGPGNFSANGTGEITLSLAPGNYTVSFHRTGTVITPEYTEIDVLPSIADQRFVLPISLSSRLQVVGENAFIFRNSSLVSSSLNSTLPLGNYTIYSFSNGKAFLGMVDMKSNETLVPSFSTGFNVTLPSNVTISGPFGSMTWSGNILLPVGNYTFTLETRVNGSYEYFASRSLFISSPQYIALSPQLRELSSSLIINTPGIPYGTFTIQGPRNETSLVGNVIDVPYGQYSIYIRSGSMAYFGNFNVSSPVTYVNATLSRAYPLNYGTYLNNTTYRGMVRLGSSYYLDPEGVIYLPNGTYHFSAETHYYYYGINDLYKVNQNVTVSGISSATLSFKIVEEINVSFFPEAGSPVLKAGQSITFPMIITSNSNIPLNFSVQGASTFTVKGGVMNLTPYSSGIMNVTITVPKGEPAGINAVNIRVYYGTEYREITVNVTVPKIYQISAQIMNKTGKISGNRIEIPLIISNRGNVNTQVNGTILNAAQLSSEGINVTFNGSSSYNGLVYAFSNNTTYLLITANKTTSIYGKQIMVLLSYENGTSIVTTSLHAPTILVTKGKGEGNGLIPYSPAVQQYYIYGLSIFIIAAMIIAMIAFRRRHRA